MNERYKGTIFSYIYMLEHILINLLVVPLLLLRIGKTEYGIYQLVASFLAYVTVFESSVTAGVMRFYCEALARGDKGYAENVLSNARIIYRILAAIVVIVGAFCITGFFFLYKDSFSEYQMRESIGSLCILFLNLVLTLLNAVYLATINAAEKFTFVKVTAMANDILCLLAYLLLLGFYPYAIAVVLIQTIFNFLMVTARKYYSEKELHIEITQRFLDKPLARKIILFSGGILLASIADQIFWKTDQIIIGKIYNADMVAVYAVGAQIYMIYMKLGITVNSVFFPKVSRLLNIESDGIEQASDLFIRVGRIAFYILLLILSGFIIFGIEFLDLWVGNAYREAYAVAIIVMVPFTIDIIQHMGLTIIQVLDLYKFRAKMYFVAALLNIVLTIAMTWRYEMNGAALATAISMFITSGIIMNWFYDKKVGLNIREFWRNIITIAIRFIPFIIVAYLGNCYCVHATGWIWLVVKIGIYTILYGLIARRFTFSDYETEIWNRFADKIGAMMRRR